MTRTMEAIPARTDYMVWAQVQTFQEEAPANHVVAQFRYLQEALDFVTYAVERNAEPIILTGPGGMASVYPKEVTA